MDSDVRDVAHKLLSKSERRALLRSIHYDDVERPDTETPMMRHCHLPKLDEHGVIIWDRETNTIREGPNFEAVQPFLE